ncbi:hypothetical protein IFT59_12755 [Rhizobium sp. CFBP 8752]|jgi:hypothetical protein|uniref:hypothetical protein n=1 Tax=Rhizobium sp. CFBP 8752 TaxID=2775301 RepID=UPI0017872EB4|nr:hypothetical protein [Rhizobium sp. CFBP 8752]MBD8664119.1 hypothetical protein [Rhizobium sp. CFBP 8752]
MTNVGEAAIDMAILLRVALDTFRGPMRNFGGRQLFSATDLMRFMGSAYAMLLVIMHLRGDGPELAQDSDDAAFLQRQGDLHEAARLDLLKASGRSVIEIPCGDFADNANATQAALRSGAETKARARRTSINASAGGTRKVCCTNA